MVQLAYVKNIDIMYINVLIHKPDYQNMIQIQL